MMRNSEMTYICFFFDNSDMAYLFTSQTALASWNVTPSVLSESEGACLPRLNTLLLAGGIGTRPEQISPDRKGYFYLWGKIHHNLCRIYLGHGGFLRQSLLF